MSSTPCEYDAVQAARALVMDSKVVGSFGAMAKELVHDNYDTVATGSYTSTLDRDRSQPSVAELVRDRRLRR